MSSLLSSFRDLTPKSFKTKWQAPSNIAFVKYWGKKGHQLPANASLSMTLKECTTTTSVAFIPDERLSVDLRFENKTEEKFAQKIRDYLESLQVQFPWILKLKIEVETSNTFPHGAGIASSASGLGALALGLSDYLRFLKPDISENHFYQRASYLARLASGSASRSVYGGFCSWGQSELSGSSDEYATPIEVHPELRQLMDSVVVISSEEKKISSTHGHQRMREHYYAEARVRQAQDHYHETLKALRVGDVEVMGEILEKEALALHALMLTSPSPYTLLKPKTLMAMEMIWDFRKVSKLPIYFTLDAGPNLHLIYPSQYKNKIAPFITHELSRLAEKIIDDETGEGPRQC